MKPFKLIRSQKIITKTKKKNVGVVLLMFLRRKQDAGIN